MSEKKPVTCKMDADVYRRVKIYCIENGLKIGDYIGRLVTKAIDNSKEQKEKQNER